MKVVNWSNLEFKGDNLGVWVEGLRMVAETSPRTETIMAETRY